MRRCSPTYVETAVAELQKVLRLSGTQHEDFPMRREQAEAVEQTLVYYQSRWAEDAKAVPRFLWNAKMRFGKTFTSYQLAKKLNAKRVLAVTFKPAVEGAWQADLDSHFALERWLYISQESGDYRSAAAGGPPVV